MLRKGFLVSMFIGVPLALVSAKPAQAEYRPDAWITMKAKLALMVSPGVDGTDINVDTIDGRSTLHGKVDSEEEKALAEETVRDIEGVRDVQNVLQVVPPSRAERVEESDEAIAERIEELLDEDRFMKESSVEVASVNNGVVLLKGEMDSLSEHLYVVSEIRAIPGVRQVETQIEVPNELADRELDRFDEQVTVTPDTEGPASSEADELEDDRNVFEDTWITTAIKTKFLASPDVPALDINVDTRDGVVVLFGVVPSSRAKDAAEQLAMEVSGVKGVTNEIVVAAGSQKKAVEAQDDEIEEQVEEALEAREQLADADIDVEVKGGVVQLKGSVASVSQRMTALTVARSVPGAKAVRNELTVEPKKRSSN